MGLQGNERQKTDPYPVQCLQIGYWRYISIYRHLQRNPDNQLYPLFEYFENWCQDENRHGDFVASLLKSQPQVIGRYCFHCLLCPILSPHDLSVNVVRDEGSLSFLDI